MKRATQVAIAMAAAAAPFALSGAAADHRFDYGKLRYECDKKLAEADGPREFYKELRECSKKLAEFGLKQREEANKAWREDEKEWREHRRRDHDD